jgi:hypothetical protein
MPTRHLGRIAQPSANHMRRETFFKFDMSGRSQVEPEFRPRFEPSLLDDLLQLGPRILLRIAVLRDYEFTILLGLLPAFV